MVGLHATAQAWGIDATDPERAAVLEIGCAHGVNLLAMASRHPQARFVGVDIDAQAIAVARRRAKQAGLTNVRFVEVDLSSFVSEAKTFDFVIAHGVYSWVDEGGRHNLLALMGRLLTPYGVGYVSYNALPGASVRLAVGEVLRGAAKDSLDAEDASLRMRAALRQLRTAPSAGTVSNRLLLDELVTLDAQPDAYLHHEFLGADHGAYGVAEFCRAAQEHGLEYLDDLAEVPLCELDLEDLREHCNAAATGRVHAEALLDAALFRSFRATLLVRGERSLAAVKGRIPANLVPARLGARPQVRAYTRLEAEELGFVTTRIHRARTLHPLHAALIRACDGTRDLDALVAMILAKIEAGELVLQTADGQAAQPEEVAAGLPMVVRDALEQLASGGLFLPSR